MTKKRKVSSLAKTYTCSVCGKKETFVHIYPIVDPFLCDECWKIENNIKTEE